jgi:hypothetical protein
VYCASPWNPNPRLTSREQFLMGYFIQMLIAPATESLSAFASLRETQSAHSLAESMARSIGVGFTSWHFGLLRHGDVNAWAPNYFLARKAKPVPEVVTAPISTRSHFKVSTFILVQATKYSARFNTFPPSILAISLERRCMLPNPSLNTDAPHAELRPRSGSPVS